MAGESARLVLGSLDAVRVLDGWEVHDDCPLCGRRVVRDLASPPVEVEPGLFTVRMFCEEAHEIQEWDVDLVFEVAQPPEDVEMRDRPTRAAELLEAAAMALNGLPASARGVAEGDEWLDSGRLRREAARLRRVMGEES